MTDDIIVNAVIKLHQYEFLINFKNIGVAYAIQLEVGTTFYEDV